MMQEINPDRQESPSRGDEDGIMKVNNDEVSPVVCNPMVGACMFNFSKFVSLI
jgi:hypothetical protein